MKKMFYTMVQYPEGEKEIFHHFLPALALGIALEQGLPIIKTDLAIIIKKLKSVLEQKSYIRWTKKYPFDYDDTLITRNIFELIEKPLNDKIKIDFANKEGVYTYLGGLKSKLNNSVDVLINLIILNYLIKNNRKDKEKLIEILKQKRKLFSKTLKQISKYYLSEGYFVYVLSKVAKYLNYDINKLILEKISQIQNKTDLGFLILASSEISETLLKKYKKAINEPLEIFQHPRLKKVYSCAFLDKVVRDCVNRKIKNIDFDEIVAKTYDEIKTDLYKYEKSADSLVKLINKYKLQKEQIVELGAGTGNLSSILAKKGYNILGVDASPDMLNIAREKTKGNPRAKYILQDIAKLKIDKVKIMYAHNFIDFKNNIVELWFKTYSDSISALRAICGNLQKEGVFFIHKKEDKGISNKYLLKNKRKIKESQLTNIYLYEDKKYFMRKVYRKTIFNAEEFIEIMRTFKMKLVGKTENWIIFQKV